MVVKILAGLVIVVTLVLLLAALKPNTFRVECSVAVAAPPQRVLRLLDDFHAWPAWAPQDRDDSTMQRTYRGAASGAGAVSDWTSRGSAGAGRMTITDRSPSEVVADVTWTRPFRAHNVNTFRLASSGSGPGATQVTWTLEGTNLYMMKVMEVFVGVNGLMGKHLDAGLASLKQAAER
jgi:uncharacterized protein YndB with AHSA1/START domain